MHILVFVLNEIWQQKIHTNKQAKFGYDYTFFIVLSQQNHYCIITINRTQIDKNKYYI